MGTFTDRNKIIEKIKFIKDNSNLTYQEIANKMRKNKVWITSVILGKSSCKESEARALISLLKGLSEYDAKFLTTSPDRSADPTASSDPVVYRFIELINVFGPALKALIQEEFGDGIMSAIDCKLDVRRKATPNGDRIVVTIDGKFLPYYNGSLE